MLCRAGTAVHDHRHDEEHGDTTCHDDDDTMTYCRHAHGMTRQGGGVGGLVPGSLLLLLSPPHGRTNQEK
jgi:hypothetical protein